MSWNNRDWWSERDAWNWDLGGGAFISDENDLDMIMFLGDWSVMEEQVAGGEKVKELRGQSFPEVEYTRDLIGNLS